MPIQPNDHPGDDGSRLDDGPRQEEPSMTTLDAAFTETANFSGATRERHGELPSLVAAGEAASVDEIPVTPPAEVLDAIDAAGRHYAALLAAGRELAFSLEPSGRVGIELRGDDGRTLNILTPSDALDVATRGSTR
jgi:hypothetical protein